MNAWTIEEVGADYVVRRATTDSVFPNCIYRTRRQAAARLLQLMELGPVAPQTWPELVEIGSIDTM